MLITVNQQDQPISTLAKLDAHLGEGILHRAFSCIIKNSKNQYLLTKRALYKPLFPTFWDLSFSSHPEQGQDFAQSVIDRAEYELGIKIKNPKDIFNYYYQARWSEIFSEHEVNHTFLAVYDGDLNINPQEISEAIWLDKKSLLRFISQNQDYVAPWILTSLDEIKKFI